MSSQSYSQIFKDMISFPHFRIGAWIIFKRNFYEFRKSILRFALFTIIVPLSLIAAIGYGLGNYVRPIDGVDYIHFFYPAVLALTVAYISFHQTVFNTHSKIYVQKHVLNILTTPISVADFVMGELSWSIAKAMLSTTIVILMGLFFDILTAEKVIPLFVISFFIASFFSAFGTLLGTYLQNEYSLSFAFFLSIMIFTLYCNTFYPLNDVGHLNKIIAYVLPLTYGIHAMREIFLKSFNWMLMAESSLLLISAVLITNWSVSRIHRHLLK